MNIFILDENPVKAAQYHCDKHMKMITESAQMLSTSHHFFGLGKNVKPDMIYKPTHVNNGCTIWVRESMSNYDWVITLAKAIGSEYTERYGKIHKSLSVINYLAENRPKLPEKGLTTFHLCMPDEFKINNDAVSSYRNFYIKDKSRFAKWKNGNVPHWYDVAVNN